MFPHIEIILTDCHVSPSHYGHQCDILSIITLNHCSIMSFFLRHLSVGQGHLPNSLNSLSSTQDPLVAIWFQPDSTLLFPSLHHLFQGCCHSRSFKMCALLPLCLSKGLLPPSLIQLPTVAHLWLESSPSPKCQLKGHLLPQTFLSGWKCLLKKKLQFIHGSAFMTLPHRSNLSTCRRCNVIWKGTVAPWNQNDKFYLLA